MRNGVCYFVKCAHFLSPLERDLNRSYPHTHTQFDITHMCVSGCCFCSHFEKFLVYNKKYYRQCDGEYFM